MKFAWEHLAAVGGSVLVILLAWFSGAWFHVNGWDRAILTGGILVIGAAAIGGFLLRARSKQPINPSAAVRAPGPAEAARVSSHVDASFAGATLAPDDINILIREAESKVASARLGHGAKLASLRVIFFLGEPGSGKTTTVLHSGLDPELLAGQVFQEGVVVPTRIANFWFARKSVLADVGRDLIAEPSLWVRLVRRLTGGGLRSVFGGKTRGERAAVVCFDCGKLVQASSPDSLVGTARSLRSRLEEMSQALGSSFPVYVLFTRADRLPYFDEFVSTFTNEESSQVLGVTLPIAAESPTSVYAERETKRLAAAFNNLFYSLAGHRLGLLVRERSPEKQASVYEFPREFSKVSKQVVQFLVELCRPSQLRAGPFLRGFYFTGVRTVANSTGSPTVMASRTNTLGSSPAPGANATTILRQGDLAASPRWETGTQIQGGESRKASQWVFLSHIFSHILLQDRSALGASGASTRVNFWRRALLATGAILCLIWISGCMVSYVSNRALVSDLNRAAQDVRAPDASSQEPSVNSLQQLENLRKLLGGLTNYERNGTPLHLRWGLYAGHEVYPEARRIYFDRFRQILFGQIQAAMVETLRRLPGTPGPNDEYIPNYDTLKAYLITTSNPEKSTPEFLSPVLQRYWAARQDLDGSARGLARTQFDFYANELKYQNPYSSQTDLQVRDHARDYLNHFGAVPRIYAAMQNAAAKQSQPVNFYRVHPGSDDVIRSVPEIPGAFTKSGWDFMQNAITHSDQYFRGEEWVLGGASEAITNRTELEAQLRAMYQTDYIHLWQDYLKSAKVAPYGSPEDAVRKLKKFSANDSPLLGLLCDASQNTAGRSADVDRAFKPVQQVVPSPCESRYVTPITNPYVGGLVKLQYCLEILVAAPPEQREIQRQQCNSASNDAKLVVASQIVPAMDLDSVGHINQTVQQLLEAPIGVPGPPPPTVIGAKALCDAFAQIATKFPFSSYPDSQDATLQEFNGFFRPRDSALARFIQANNGILVLEGTQYVLKAGVKADWSPAFQSFFNKTQFIQRSLYSGEVSEAQYKFTVRAAPPEGGISGVTFTLNGQSLTYPGGSQTVSFTWPGTGVQAARITYRTEGSQDTTVLSPRGPWAILRIFSMPGAKVTTSGTALRAALNIFQVDGHTPVTLSGFVSPIVVHLDFDAGGEPFVFQSSYFSNLGCRANR